MKGNIVFDGVLSGAEIVARNPHQLVKADEQLYNYKESDYRNARGVVSSEAKRIPTEEENLAQLIEEQKAQVLQDLITAKALDDTESITRLQSEYLVLMGGVALPTKEDIIDAYTLELIEGGYLV